MTEKELSKKIDELVNQLKKDLLNVPYNSRGVWDRVKNWWQNLTKTADNPDNPYYFTNKFGSLGKFNNDQTGTNPPEENSEKDTEEVPSEEDFKLGTAKESNIIKLGDYKILKEEFLKLDEKVSLINENYTSNNLKNLEMFRIIDSWAVNFKKQIISLLKNKIELDTETVADTDKTNKESSVSVLPRTASNKTSDKILFKEWIRNVDNIHYFIEMVNHIFSDPVRYRKPIRSIAEILKSKSVLAPKKGEVGTPLDISIRNEILRMIKKEVEINTKQEDSIFRVNVWNWARNLESMKERKEKKESPIEADSSLPPERVATDFEEEPASGEFLDI